MEHWLGRYAELAYAVMRFVVGLLFACHGAQKLFGVLGGTRASDAKMVTAGVIELAGGVLIAIGLFGGFAAFIASGEMAVAYFTAHAPRGFWPITNAGEPAVLFCFVFLYVACRGSGPYSVDRLWSEPARTP
jgi:putative oxidoreductase